MNSRFRSLSCILFEIEGEKKVFRQGVNKIKVKENRQIAFQ